MIDGRYVMGTILQVELCSIDPAAQRAALDATFTAARHIDEMLTTYAADGPTSRFNAHAGQGAQALPPEVIEVLASARSHHILTAGTFDVTVGPLLALWRVAGENGRIPAPQALAAARARVGSERILLGSDGRSAALPDQGMAVDFGGIGKGYALDRLMARLRASGLDRALLDFGRSSVWALGQPPDAPAWRLLLEHPSRGAIGVISLRDRRCRSRAASARAPRSAVGATVTSSIRAPAGRSSAICSPRWSRRARSSPRC